MDGRGAARLALVVEEPAARERPSGGGRVAVAEALAGTGAVVTRLSVDEGGTEAGHHSSREMGKAARMDGLLRISPLFSEYQTQQEILPTLLARKLSGISVCYFSEAVES